MSERSLSPESLLEHKEFVRKVARRILPDEHLVDDVVQETYLRALRSPPRKPGALRAWMGSVARNLSISVVRGRRRRRERERERERAEPTGSRRPIPAPHEAAVLLEGHRLVVDAVLALKEPLRSTVIYRYYEELPPREIARLQGVPVATVHSRLRRAVGHLRQRLDESHGGDRALWCLALLPLVTGFVPPAAVGGGTTVLSIGGAAMKAKITMAALVLCVVGTALIVWKYSGGSGDDQERATETGRQEHEVGREAGTGTRPRETVVGREVQPDRPSGTGAGKGKSDSGKKTGKGGEPGAEEGEGENAVVVKPVGSRPGAGAVVGTVKLEGDEPLGAATVRLYWRTRDENGLLQPNQQETTPDGAGGFRFDALQPRTYRLEVEHPDYARHSFEFRLGEREGAGPFPIVLKKGGSILARLRGAHDEPLMDRLVTAQRHGERFTTGARTDLEGVALLDRLAPGDYSVSVPDVDADGQPTGRADKKRMVTVQPGKTIEVEFKSGCRLTGVVADAANNPIADAIVRLVPAKFGPEGYRHSQTRTDGAGGFEIGDLAPGEYRITIQVVGKESWVASAGTVKLEPGQSLDHAIRIRPGTLSGRITRADTGAGLGKLDVSIQAHAVEEKEGGKDGEFVRTGARASVWADESGNYRFVGLQPSFYEVWIFPRDKSLESVMQIVDFTAGGTLAGIDFALKVRTLGTLRLSIKEPDGSPATGVNFSYKRGKFSVTLHGKQVGDGIYEFPMESGPQEVRASRRGYEIVTLNVTIVEGETLSRTIQLKKRERGILKLTVREANGDPATDVSFWIQIGTSGAAKIYARHLGEGVYEIRLDAGARTVHVHRDKQTRLGTVSVEIVEDETVERTLNLGG